MPKIYSQQQKDEIVDSLLEIGLLMIKQNGLRGLNIETLTKQVGIAPGTFYSFFQSKEMLVYTLIENYERKIQLDCEKMIGNEGKITRTNLKQIYMDMMLRDDGNILRFLKTNEVYTLLRKLPSKEKKTISDVHKQFQNILSFVDTNRDNINYDLCINWIQIMNILLENKQLLIADVFETNMERIIENLLDEVFGRTI